ncbi:hypothetical protein CCR95_14545 [Thiocystis minor]|uniref:hypothetical protein n=1 Tax=Thiocystis minor TaxID=61597 RepID=UPI0019120C99|nr:hypothetical protein [Thiocystis minor]MBK5965273.1 hypothetical protein [Thiocystis minor]
MNIGELVQFHSEHFFEGAVQLRWVREREARAEEVARSFVFHGPRYHGAGEADQEGVDRHYRLKDSASFVADLLDSILSGLAGTEHNPYLLVVAGYGAGKSHLATTGAVLLGAPQGPVATDIVARIAQADAAIGRAVEERLARLGKPVLVLCLDGMSGFHLGDALSQAVFAQLERYGVDAGAIRALSPRFQTAEQFVQRNFAFRAETFARHLPGLDAETIGAGLRNQDETLYSAVDAIYTDANGSPIPVTGQESAQELINTLCEVYCGPDGAFASVVILFDEFGRYLEYAADKPQLAGDLALQQIFQGVQDNSGKVRFIGFIQYALKTYLTRFSSAGLRQLQRYITRFDTAEKAYLSTNLETLFAHLIGKDETRLAEVWSQSRADGAQRITWQRMSRGLPGFERFPVWNEPEKFARVIAQGCWPLHPLATWFLTRQSDVVQSRSALTVVKEAIERIGAEPAISGGELRQVSAAELLLRHLLPEMLAAERGSGAAVAETLQILLEKFQSHLTADQRLVLAGVAILEKMRVGKQTQTAMDDLLCEATALDAAAAQGAARALGQELGAIEWNADLGQYELIADASTRGQFQQWLRQRQSALTSEAVRDLFVRNAAKDGDLVDIPTDFGHLHDIATTEWFFEARWASVQTVENVLKEAVQEWERAILPKEAKGRVIYLYLQADDDLAAVDATIERCLREETRRVGQAAMPVWVIGLADGEGAVAEHLGRIHIFTEPLAAEEQERFRRFVPEERERSRLALKEALAGMIRERRFWIAGCEVIPDGRLKNVGEAIFARVYPKVTPFPFDGFATAAGGGPADAAQITRSLIARQVDGPWVQAQPKRLQNRVRSILVDSWRVLASSGKLTAPGHPELKAMLDWLQTCHAEDPKRTLLISYRALIAPPYGMNAASAGLLLGLLLDGQHPPRRIVRQGEMVAASDWVNDAFSAKHGRHHLEQGLLETTTLRFLSEDSAGRWRDLLERWEAEQNHERKVALGKEAEKMNQVDPLPAELDGNFKYLRDKSEASALKLRQFRAQLDEWENGIERAERQNNVGELLRLSTLLLRRQQEVSDGVHWSPTAVDACNDLLIPLREMVSQQVAGWIPRQSCHNAIDVGSFRHRIEKAIGSLKDLAFESEARALEQQSQRAILQVEKRQRFALTLAESDDYPRQPEPSESTPVRDLHDDIEKGERLIEGVQAAQGVLEDQEIQARVDAIKPRLQQLRAALQRQRARLGELYDVALDSEEALKESLLKANRLRHIFLGTPDEGGVGEMVVQLERVLSDVADWESGEVGVERLETLLRQQSAQQLAALETFLADSDIEPAWTMAAIYQGLVESRLSGARRRSADWVSLHQVDESRLAEFDAHDCARTEQELRNAPAYLAEEDRARIERLLTALGERLAEHAEQERRARVTAWQQRFLSLGPVEQFDRHATDDLLKALRGPPDALSPAEQALVEPVISALTAHLDRMSMDDIVARIEQLTLARQREIFERLAARLEEREVVVDTI